jgi:hypothetical protein
VRAREPIGEERAHHGLVARETIASEREKRGLGLVRAPRVLVGDQQTYRRVGGHDSRAQKENTGRRGRKT